MKLYTRLITMILFCTFAWVQTGNARPPNVIVIMADDLGAEGLNCYGSTIYSTPQLDRMAAEGIRFNNAYSTPLCTPTRVMIMSGLYPDTTGYVALLGKKKDARMPADIRTFGHDFKDAGYKTAIAGKWQLGQFDTYPGQPAEHGFEQYCMWSWFYGGVKTSRFYEPSYHTDGKTIQGGPEDYGPDIYSKFLLDFIDEHKNEPFLIYYPMALVHSPFVDPPPHLNDLAESKFTADISDKTKSFGRMITYMDDIIGQMMNRLKEHGIAEDTLIIFTADNGTHKAITSKLDGEDLDGGKGDMIESGTRVPFIAWWPGTIKPAVSDAFICLVDVLPTICALAEIDIDRDIDGMDLSHYLLDEAGVDREFIYMAYKGGQYFVRDENFRYNIGGKKQTEETLYFIPVDSNQERYSEKKSSTPEHAAEMARLKAILESEKAQPRN